MGPMRAWYSLGVSTQAAWPWGAAPLSAEAEARFIAGVEYCGRFFVGESEAHKALYKLTALLDTDGLLYAIIGAFALLEYGHRRVAVDVDLVMREEDLQKFKRRHLEKGDDKPKPIAFPDPAAPPR